MSVFSSIVNAFSAQKAAKAQKRAADEANALTKQQYEQTRSDLAPYRQFGEQSTNFLNDAYGFNGQAGYDRSVQNFRQDPGYQFALGEGLKSVEGSAAARGGLYSGGTMKALQARGQGLADQQYGNWLGRYQQGQGTGYASAAATGNFGATAAQQRGQYIQDRGAANAQSILAPAQAWQQFNNDASKFIGQMAGTGAFK